MAKIEADSRWNLNETINHSMGLQDQIINQEEAMEMGIIPYHAHFFGWGSPEPEEAEDIRRKYEQLIRCPDSCDSDSLHEDLKNELTAAFAKHLAQQEIEGKIYVSSRLKVPLYPNGLIMPEGHIWPIRSSLRVFGWIDYKPRLEITDPEILQRWPSDIELPEIGPSLNTTQLGDGSEFFTVDFAVGERVLVRDKAAMLYYYESRISELRDSTGIRALNTNSFSMSCEGQRIITGLLECR